MFSARAQKTLTKLTQKFLTGEQPSLLGAKLWQGSMNERRWWFFTMDKAHLLTGVMVRLSQGGRK